VAIQARIEKLLPPPASSFILKTRREPSFGPYWHFHPEYQVTLVRRGRGKRFVGDDVARFEPGDLVLTGPNLPHMWCSSRVRRRGEAPHEAVILQFPDSLFGGRFLDLPELGAVRRLLERSARGLGFGPTTRRRVGPLMVRMGEERGAARLILLLEILHRLSRSADARELSSGAFRPSLASADRHRIDRVCRFIGERAGGPLTLAEAAAGAHLSVPAFTRFFRRCTGRSFLRYLTELRIGAACRLLLETDRRVADVGRASGFPSPATFHRRFRAAKGVSPKGFRARFHSTRPSASR
jgi:AraC-like DNA-binding protein